MVAHLRRFLTQLICLQYSDSNFGGRDVSRDVLHVRGGRVVLKCVVFSRHLSGSMVWYDQI